MKIFFLVFMLTLPFFLTNNGVKIVYLEEKPGKIDELTYSKLEGRDFLESPESIIKNLESRLIDIAKERQATKIEIFILEQSKPEIPTESQFGRKGFVSILFSLKN